MGKGGKSRQPANNRSNSMNPNNPASVASQTNRANQLNPTSPAFKSSRGSSRPKGGGPRSKPATGSTLLPSGWTPTSGCELCENTGPHSGPCGYFQEGEFYEFPDDSDEAE
jgi:hypothetical protein